MIEYFFDMCYMLPFCIFSLISVATFPEILDKKWIIVLFSALFCMAVDFLVKSKNKMKYLIPVVSLAIFGAFFLLKEPGERLAFAASAKWILWYLLGAAVSFFVAFFAKRNKWTRRITAVIIVAGIIIAMNLGVVFDKLATAFAFLEMLILVIDEIQDGWIKTGGEDRKKHVVYTAPFAILLATIVFLCPVGEKPYDWQFAVDIWEQVLEEGKKLYQSFNKREEEYADVGFSDFVGSSAGINQNYKELLAVTADRNSGNVIYLKGKTFDSFENGCWTVKKSQGANDSVLDAIETWCAATSYDKVYYYDYVKSSKLNVRYLLFDTKYFFMPGKSIIKSTVPEEMVYVENKDSVMAQEMMNYDSGFEVAYYVMNRNQEQFGDFLANSPEITEEKWNEALGNFPNSSKYSYGDYLNYSAEIRQIYSENIQISDELKEALAQVYKSNDSDFEKLKKIENWLLTFNYSTNPGGVPKEVDTASEFLDYFLLETRQGYCVHFATCFVLLARYEGIPARLAQGFYIDNNGTENIVSSNMIHVWPEVYFKNVGWINFDPTPNYGTTYVWGISKKDAIEEVTPDIIYDRQPDVPEDTAESQETVEEETEPLFVFPWKLVLVPLLTTIVLVVLFVLIYRYLLRKRLVKLDEEKKVILLAKYNLQILEMLGYAMLQGETLEEYSKRLCNEGMDRLKFLSDYEEILYADNKPETKELETVQKDKHYLVLQYRDNKRIFKGVRMVKLCLVFGVHITSL